MKKYKPLVPTIKDIWKRTYDPAAPPVRARKPRKYWTKCMRCGTRHDAVKKCTFCNDSRLKWAERRVFAFFRKFPGANRDGMKHLIIDFLFVRFGFRVKPFIAKVRERWTWPRNAPESVAAYRMAKEVAALRESNG